MHPQQHQQQQQHQQIERQIIQNQTGAPYASSATKELDDLMASLSDFKVSLKKNFKKIFYNLL